MRDLDALIQDNRGLVYQIARRYLSACQRDNAVDVDDLIQGGMIGLMDAAQSWDPERGAWSTHAAVYIRNGMRAALGLRHRNPTRHQGLYSLDKPISTAEGLSLIHIYRPGAAAMVQCAAYLLRVQRARAACLLGAVGPVGPVQGQPGRR